MKRQKRYTYYVWLKWAKGDDVWRMHTQLNTGTGVYVQTTHNGIPLKKSWADPKRFGKKQLRDIKKLQDAGYAITCPMQCKHVYQNDDGLWVEDREASRAVPT